MSSYHKLQCYRSRCYLNNQFYAKAIIGVPQNFENPNHRNAR